MSTIAYRAGIMAADTGFVRGQTTMTGVSKVARAPDGTLVGTAGRGVFAGAIHRWVAGGMNGDQPEANENDDNLDVAIIVRPCGRIEIHEPGGWYEAAAPYIAIGSGRDQALGAMHAGADAAQAVEAAIEHDVYTSGEVETVRACVRRQAE